MTDLRPLLFLLTTCCAGWAAEPVCVPLTLAGHATAPGVVNELAWHCTSPLGSLPYWVEDYAGHQVATGALALGSDQVVHWSAALPRGYYEIVLGAAEERFGLLVQDAFGGPTDPFFGIDAVLNWLDRRPSIRAVVVPLLKRTGIAMARERLSWRQINPKAGQFNWDEHDHARDLRGLYAAAGIPVLEMFHDRGPTDGPFPRKSIFPQDLSSVVRGWPVIHDTLAASWGGLEVWNEPEGGYGSSLPADQYLPVVKAMRYALQGKVGAAPIGGGVFVGGDPGEYHRFCALNGLLDHVDFVSFHDYKPVESLERLVQRHRAWLAENGHPGMPLWISECGLPWAKGGSRPKADEDALSALAITMKGVEAKACGITRYMPFCLAFYEEGGTKSFSMLGREVTPLRSFAAYAQAIRVLSGREYCGDLALSGTPCARVFAAPAGDMVAVLYTGQATATRELALPPSALRAEGIDGRALTLGADGHLMVADGMAYVWFATAPAGLQTATAAMELMHVSRLPSPAAPPASPIVLQFLPDLAQVIPSTARYLVSAQTASALHVTVRVHNLAAEAKSVHLHLQLPGTTTASDEQALTVPASSTAEATWTVDVHAGLGALDIRPLVVSGTIDDGGAISALALPLQGEGELAACLVALPQTTCLSLNELARWQENIAAPGRQTLSTSAPGAWRLAVDFTPPGERWVYPRFALTPGQFDHAKGLLLRLRAARSAGVRLMLFDQDEGGFWTSLPIAPADGQWHVVYVPLSQFEPLPSHPDKTNGEIVRAQVRRLAIGMHDESSERSNTLDVSDLFIVGGAP